MSSPTVDRWKCVYSLDSKRSCLSGSEEALAAAIRRGADLRINTEFRHNEHIDIASPNAEVIQEVADFRVTYLLEDRWSAGIINLRQPVSLPDGFGPHSSMSFFLYNQNGLQAIARPHLEGTAPTAEQIQNARSEHKSMPKYHLIDNWDTDTTAPSRNFVYDFDVYRFCVNDEWEEVLSHSADGTVLRGSLEALAKSFATGCEVKVAIRGLCADLAAEPAVATDHEVFVHLGSCYYYTESKLFMAISHPVVRVRPVIPIRYESRNWDFGWLIARTDGNVARRLADPRTLKFRDDHKQYAMRWFVR